MSLVVTLALLAAGTSADDVFGTSVLDVIVVPDNGATVPTNAHMFFPLPLPLIVTLSTPDDVIPLVLDVIPATGVPLGDLPPNSDIDFVLDDGVDVRPVSVHTAAGPDHEPPSLRGDPETLVITSEDNPAKVVLTLPAATDDFGVAVYRAASDDGRVFLAAAPSQDTPSVDIGGFVDTREPVDLTFTVTAVDLAGNTSAASAPRTVHVPARVNGGGCGGSSTTTTTTFGAALVLLGRRRRLLRRPLDRPREGRRAPRRSG